jgi:citrate lyase subunit beta/citryl-CoA lyase
MSIPIDTATTTPIASPFKSWLFAAGHDLKGLEKLIQAKPAVIVIDLEEFTPAEHKPQACELFSGIVTQCDQSNVRCAIRLDQLDNGGLEQLKAIAAAKPFAVFLPQIDKPETLQTLRNEMDSLGLVDTPMVPTIESQQGLEKLDEILSATRLSSAALLGTGDLSADLGLSSNPDRMSVLQPLREQFASTCKRHGVDAIDGPWPELVEPLLRTAEYQQDCDFSRGAGFKSRCALTIEQVLAW